MPEYVYAVHDFLPENEDEIGFSVGERIEVLEKDDQYGDGWWQGRNLSGKDGLFPVSYTTSTANGFSGTEVCGTKYPLQPLNEESESDSLSILSPVPKASSVPSFLDMHEETDGLVGQEKHTTSHRKSSSDGEVMRATMTDVQKAIEQLGKGESGVDELDDGVRSFSFASTKGGGETETDDTDFDLSDLDGGFQDGGKEDWHKNARRRLAAKAKRAVENAEQLEVMMNGTGSSTRRAVAPPIDAEISDESEAEEDADFTRTSQLQRTHLGVLEEDENEPVNQRTGGRHKDLSHDISAMENVVELPPMDESDIPTATAAVQVFPLLSEPPAGPLKPESKTQAAVEKSLEASYPTPTSPASVSHRPLKPPRSISEAQKRVSSPLPSNGVPFLTTAVHVKHNSVGSASSTLAMSSAQPLLVQTPIKSSPIDELRTIPYSEWSLEQVVEWLKSKGFDQDVCDKFAEQEITGDVLPELDASILKNEIGILAYGKRARIVKAIAELCRPASFESLDQHVSSGLPSPVRVQTQVHRGLSSGGLVPILHSRAQSQSQQSSRSFSGTSTATHPKHRHSQSIQSSSGSPFDSTSQHEQLNAMSSIPVQDTFVSTQQSDASTTGVGLGIDTTSDEKGPQCSPSSDVVSSEAATILPGASVEDDKGHGSEGETAPTATSVRRRLFGRSHDSTHSVTKTVASKDSPLPSPTVHSDKDSTKEKEKDSPRNSGSFSARKGKKNSDGGRHGDRLSIFGGTFGSTLNKHRKPAPSDDTVTERKFTLPRLQSTIRKSASVSNRTSTPVGSPNEKTSASVDHSPIKDQLRNRSASASQETPDTNTTVIGENHVVGSVKQGQSIMQQIGKPNHAGWMRKKGERYNIWKTRYFVLQGPHLYCLRSDNNAETRLKEYININGYRVTVDEEIDPGRYGFRIDHDHDKTHYFSSEEKAVVREWMKAIMKATIARDYTKPVISSCNISTIPLVVAQAMNPAPRPPSPTARAATQRAMRRENTSQLSTRDARVLMGLPGDSKEERTRVDSYFGSDNSPRFDSSKTAATPPPRPSRETRRASSIRTTMSTAQDDALIEWANAHLPEQHQIVDPSGSLCNGLTLLRLAESIKGQPSSPPVLDSAFPVDAIDEKLDGLVKLFDFLLDNDVKMGSVSINDVRLGKRDKIIQLLKALKSWEEKRKMLSTTLLRTQQHYSLSGFNIPIIM